MIGWYFSQSVHTCLTKLLASHDLAWKTYNWLFCVSYEGVPYHPETAIPSCYIRHSIYFYLPHIIANLLLFVYVHKSHWLALVLGPKSQMHNNKYRFVLLVWFLLLMVSNLLLYHNLDDLSCYICCFVWMVDYRWCNNSLGFPSMEYFTPNSLGISSQMSHHRVI